MRRRQAGKPATTKKIDPATCILNRARLRQRGRSMYVANDESGNLSQEWFTTWEVAPGVICIAEDQHERGGAVVSRDRVGAVARVGRGDGRRGHASGKSSGSWRCGPRRCMMVCSHSHFDHVGDVWRFAAAGVPVYAHPAEADRIARGHGPRARARTGLQEKFLLGPLPLRLRPGDVRDPPRDGDASAQ